MNQSDKNKIDIAADDSIARMRAARLATKEAASRITRPAPNTPELQPLLDHVSSTHETALNAARSLSTAVTSARVESIFSSLQLAVGTVEAAKRAADQLRATPTPEQASRASEADDEAVAQIADLKAAFQNAPELGTIKRGSFFGDLLRTPQGWIACAVFVIAVVCLFVLFTGIFGAANLVEKLAHVEYARGLITFFLAVGTIAVALALVVGALLGSEDNKDNFTRAKEVLTVLIGVFGTILGFYYGSAKSERGRFEVSPLAIKQSADGKQASLTTIISGGEPSYTYSIQFDDSAVVKNIDDQETHGGKVNQTIDTSQIPPGEAVGFTFVASDSKNQISLKSAEDQKLKGTPKGTPIPTPTTPSKSTP